MFLGEYNHSIDSKNRVIVPAKFREELGESCFLVKGFDGCLNIYSKAEWLQFQEKLVALPVVNADMRKLARTFMASAMEQEFDKQGRILISSTYKAYAEMDKEIVFAGVGKKVEIWSKEKWESTATFGFEEMDEAAARLSELGIMF